MSIKNRYKTRAKRREKTKGDNEPNQKKRKGNKMLRKNEKGRKKNFDKKTIKRRNRRSRF
jgi:hypothetical protein